MFKNMLFSKYVRFDNTEDDYHIYNFISDMASSSRQALRPSNQSAQQQHRQLNPLHSSNNKSLPAILSRKRKLENNQMVSSINKKFSL